MQAMVAAAKTDKAIAARVNLFRHRIPEELYDLEKDPDCLHNLMDNPEYKPIIESMQKKLNAQMTKTKDPILKAFENRTDQVKVEEAMTEAYGNFKRDKPKGTKTKKNKKDKKKK